MTDRFWIKTRRAKNGCLIWTSARLRNGYGVFNTKREDGKWRNSLAHRVAFELAIRPLLPGEMVDHACHNLDDTCSGGWQCIHRPCVEPTHLEAVTQRVNLLRGQTITAANAAKTHCVNQHAFTPENTLILKNGARACRACNRNRQAATKARKRAARAAS
jgi:hypothetical protein